MSLSRIARNRSGSTLMTVMMVMLILSIIAVGAIQAASNNVIQAKKVDNYERLYYGAESVLGVAADLLRKEVAEYYNSTLRDAAISDYTTYGNLQHSYLAAKNSFPSAVAQNCTVDFITPDLTGYQYGGIDTTTVFNNGVKISEVDGVSTYIFTISCEAEENGTTREYEKYVEITLEDIDVSQDISRPPQIDVALAVGGTLRVPTYAVGTKIYVYSSPAKSSSGNALVGATSLSSGSQLICKGNPIDPTVVKDLDWRINVGLMLSNMRNEMVQMMSGVPEMNLCAQPTSGSWTYDNVTSVELSTSTYSNMRIRGKSGSNLSITTSILRDVTLNDTTLIVSTANLTLSGSSLLSRVLTIKNGTIWAQGSLTLNTRVRINCASSSTPVKLWSGSNTTISDTVNLASIYAGGSINVSGKLTDVPNAPTNDLVFYCYAKSGSVTLSNSGNTVHNTLIYSGGGVTLNGTYSKCTIYSTGAANLTGTFNDCKIYSGGKMQMDGVFTDCDIHMGSFSATNEILDNDNTLLNGGTKIYSDYKVYINADDNWFNSENVEIYDSRIYAQNDITFEYVSINNEMTEIDDGCVFVSGNNINLCAAAHNSNYIAHNTLTMNGVLAYDSLFYGNQCVVLEGILDVTSASNGVIYTNGNLNILISLFRDPVDFEGGQILVKGDMIFPGSEWYEIWAAYMSHSICYDGTLKSVILSQSNLDSLGVIPEVSDELIVLLPESFEVFISESTQETG